MESRLLLHGGRIHVCDGVTAAQEALLIEGDRVIAVGKASDLRAAAGAQVEELDLQGADAMPGLIDTHPHFMHFSAFETACVNILDVTSHEEIVDRIKQRAAITPPGQWIITTPIGEPHYFIRRWYTDLQERRMPDRYVLDRATTKHPVLIQAWAPRTPNIVAFNSLGLRLAGISGITPDQVCSVRVEKDEHGTPTGILRGPVVNYYSEDPFWLEVLSKLPPPPETLWRAGGLAGQKLANRLGVTTAYEAHGMDPVHIAAYRDIRARGEATIRVQTALEVVNTLLDPHYQPTSEDVIARLALAKSLEEKRDELFRCHGASFGRGGPCWPGFLRIHDEMKNPDGKLTRGKTFISQETERLVIDYCLKHDIRLNMIQGGYRDHDEFFASLSPFERTHDIPSRNWISQHNILTTPQQCQKLADLNMSITTSVSFVWGKGDIYGERIGKQCWRDLIPLKRFLKAGATVSCGTDWGPKNIFHHIALAETHEFAASGHCNATPDHKVSRLESLMMWTRDAARVLQWDDIGTLSPGKKADITIVDRDPVQTRAEQMEATVVLRTMLGGRTVHDSGVLRETELGRGD